LFPWLFDPSSFLFALAQRRISHPPVEWHQMNISITSDSTVRDVLKTCPDSAQAFFLLRTDCVGCWLQRFCTLKDVCGAYALDMEEVIKTLQESSVHPSQRRML
jgi:hypothetical protein